MYNITHISPQKDEEEKKRRRDESPVDDRWNAILSGKNYKEIDYDKKMKEVLKDTTNNRGRLKHFCINEK